MWQPPDGQKEYRAMENKATLQSEMLHAQETERQQIKSSTIYF